MSDDLDGISPLLLAVLDAVAAFKLKQPGGEDIDKVKEMQDMIVMLTIMHCHRFGIRADAHDVADAMHHAVTTTIDLNFDDERDRSITGALLKFHDTAGKG